MRIYKLLNNREVTYLYNNFYTYNFTTPQIANLVGITNEAESLNSNYNTILYHPH